MDQTKRRDGPPVNVCLISPYSPSLVTGVGRFIQDLARQLVASGSSCFMVHPDPPCRDQSLDDESVTLRFHRFRDIELATRTAVRLIRRRREFRVAHVQQIHVQSGVAALIARMLGKSCVLTLHLRHPTPVGRFRRLANRLVTWACFAYAVCPVAVSEPTAESFGNRRILVVENGVDATMFAPSSATRERVRRYLGGLNDDIVFVFAGRWSLQKGFDLLLQAVRSDVLHDKQYHLLILGSRAPDEPRLLEDNLPPGGTSDRVQVLGPVDQVSAFLNAGDVLVLPSRAEGMPLVFLEAEAVGLPVLASDIPVHEFLRRRSGCGWSFRSGNAEDLARVMADIIAVGVPAEWKQRVRQSILQHHTLEAMAGKYVSIYERLSSAG